MYFKNYVFVLMLVVAMFTNAQECTYTLKGRVIDFHDGQPLAAAQLYVKEVNRSFITK